MNYRKQLEEELEDFMKKNSIMSTGTKGSFGGNVSMNNTNKESMKAIEN